MPVGPPGIAEEEDEVVLPDALGRDLEEALRLVRDVGRGEIGRAAVGPDVSPEEREVAGVARPHPVVLFAAELADGPGWHIDQPDVLEIGIEEEDVGLAGEHLRDLGPLARVGLLGRGHDLLDPPFGRLGPGGGVHGRLDGGQDLGRNVAEGLGDPGRHALGLDLPVARSGQEAVAEVVVLARAGRLGGAEGRDERACGPDLDDAVDEPDAVRAEDLLRRDLEAPGPQVEPADLADRIHALLGPGRGQGDDRGRQKRQDGRAQGAA